LDTPSEPLRKLDRILQGETPVEVCRDEELFVVRLFDMFDGWIDISGALPKEEADRLLNEKTENGTKSVRYDDGDYYRIFPANTRMLVTPEYLGR
jgi:hypothetical protein